MESNEKENTLYQNLWSTVITVFRGKGIALNAFLIREKKRWKIKKLVIINPHHSIDKVQNIK